MLARIPEAGTTPRTEVQVYGAAGFKRVRQAVYSPLLLFFLWFSPVSAPRQTGTKRTSPSSQPQHNLTTLEVLRTKPEVTSGVPHTLPSLDIPVVPSTSYSGSTTGHQLPRPLGSVSSESASATYLNSGSSCENPGQCNRVDRHSERSSGS
ncbi:hypothetical protein WJX74_009409 [Apatococcus lobatus]|uniref:Uncharacterized protein n=1 Tax=Apatococcus lobatus TaxID=904363 RepID=A0AAW1QV07_9CHLO